jgi:chromodomain-helicase-DNA-binding protein 7
VLRILQVLIFSQFKIMLDVLEDYMRLCGHACERIDGSTSSRDRQAAIDRYSKGGWVG